MCHHNCLPFLPPDVAATDDVSSDRGDCAHLRVRLDPQVAFSNHSRGSGSPRSFFVDYLSWLRSLIMVFYKPPWLLLV